MFPRVTCQSHVLCLQGAHGVDQHLCILAQAASFQGVPVCPGPSGPVAQGWMGNPSILSDGSTHLCDTLGRIGMNWVDIVNFFGIP